MRMTEVTVARHMGHFFEALRMISSVRFTPGCQRTSSLWIKFLHRNNSLTHTFGYTRSLTCACIARGNVAARHEGVGLEGVHAHCALALPLLLRHDAGLGLLHAGSTLCCLQRCRPVLLGPGGERLGLHGQRNRLVEYETLHGLYQHGVCEVQEAVVPDEGQAGGERQAVQRVVLPAGGRPRLHGQRHDLQSRRLQDTTSGYPTLREAIQRTSPTLVRISQLTESNRVYGLEEKRQGKSKIGWAQAVYPLRARLQELKNNALTQMWDEVLEDELLELKSGEQAFMATRPKLIQAGDTTLDSIPRIQKGSGTRIYCPALKWVDSKTQEQSKWI